MVKRRELALTLSLDAAQISTEDIVGLHVHRGAVGSSSRIEATCLSGKTLSWNLDMLRRQKSADQRSLLDISAAVAFFFAIGCELNSQEGFAALENEVAKCLGRGR